MRRGFLCLYLCVQKALQGTWFCVPGRLAACAGAAPSSRPAPPVLDVDDHRIPFTCRRCCWQGRPPWCTGTASACTGARWRPAARRAPTCACLLPLSPWRSFSRRCSCARATRRPPPTSALPWTLHITSSAAAHVLFQKHRCFWAWICWTAWLQCFGTKYATATRGGRC